MPRMIGNFSYFSVVRENLITHWQAFGGRLFVQRNFFSYITPDDKITGNDVK